MSGLGKVDQGIPSEIKIITDDNTSLGRLAALEFAYYGIKRDRETTFR